MREVPSTAEPAAAASRKVPGSVYGFLGIGLVSGSQSGNIIRLGHAGAAAISAWRLLLAVIVLAPLSRRQVPQLGRLSAREWVLLVASGIALGLHFVCWIAAVQRTTVANACILFAVNPVFTALGATLIFGEVRTGKLLGGLALGVGGVVVVGAEGVSLAARNRVGDLLALGSALLFTIYFLAGKRLRPRLDTRIYVTAVYGIAALTSFAFVCASGAPLVDYDAQTWLTFALLAVFPTLIGHTAINHALRYIDASRLSVATLGEPLLAAVVAYFAWGEAFTWATAVGYALVCAAVVLVVWDWSEIARAAERA